MNDEQSRAALASLGGPLVVLDAQARDRQSEQVLPHLRQLVRGIPARRRRKQWQRRVVASGGLVASLALAVGVWCGLGRKAAPFEVERGPAASQNDERHGYFTGADAGATLRTRQGAQVSLTANTRLAEVSSEPRHELLRLTAGSLSVRVPKLGTGATFAVQTPDSLVTVHGTVFSVTVLGNGLVSETCVTVSEGLVAVEHEGKRTMVGPGQQHNCQPRLLPSKVSAGAPSAAPSSVIPLTSPSVSLTPRERRSSSRQFSSPPARAAETDESLAAQNRLLATALQAERAGHFAEARNQLQELLTRYPASPLRADAERSLSRVSRQVP